MSYWEEIEVWLKKYPNHKVSVISYPDGTKGLRIWPSNPELPLSDTDTVWYTPKQVVEHGKMNWQDVVEEFDVMPGQDENLVFQRMAEEIAKLRAKEETWGNEFSAICAAKEQLDKLRAQSARLIADLQLIKSNPSTSTITKLFIEKSISSDDPDGSQTPLAVRRAMEVLRKIMQKTNPMFISQAEDALAELKKWFGE